MTLDYLLDVFSINIEDWARPLQFASKANIGTTATFNKNNMNSWVSKTNTNYAIVITLSFFAIKGSISRNYWLRFCAKVWQHCSGPKAKQWCKPRRFLPMEVNFKRFYHNGVTYRSYFLSVTKMIMAYLLKKTEDSQTRKNLA